MSRGPRIRIDARTGLVPGAPAGWPTAWSEGIGTLGGTLALDPLPHGALGLGSTDDTLGGLVAPRRATRAADGTAYLLGKDGTLLVLRPGDARFGVALPPGAGVTLGEPVAVLAADGLLLLADARPGRVLAFRREAGLLAAVLSAPGADDLAFAGGTLFVLDARAGVVLAAGPALDRLRPRLETCAPGAFDRLIAAPDGRLFLRHAGEARLAVFGPDGVRLPDVTAAAPLHSLLPTPAIATEGSALLIDGRRFDGNGRPLPDDPLSPVPPPAYPRRGAWVGQSLDAGHDDARWGRVELELAAFPPGTRIALASRTANRPGGVGADGPWDSLLQATAPEEGEAPRRLDGWVQSQPGRYLQLRVELAGGGRATPEVAGVELRHDGRSLVDLLPVLYREDPESRRFLERFLGLAERALDPIEAGLRSRAVLFDPRLAPAARLPAIARLLAMTDERGLDEEARRRLLRGAQLATGAPGTPMRIRGRTAAALATLTGRAPEDHLGYPRLVEGFAERSGAALDVPETLLDAGIALGGEPAETDGLRLAPVREGPSADSAYRLRIVLPGTWVAGSDALRLVERVAASEMPAHIAWRIDLADAGTVLDRDDRLDIDAILGGEESAGLGEAEKPAGPRLDVDLVLGAGDWPPARLSGSGIPLDRSHLM
jgi:phage tail-like protein